jgi:hypothetical protein
LLVQRFKNRGFLEQRPAENLQDFAAIGRALLGPRPVSDDAPLHKGKADLDFRNFGLITKREKSDNP